MRDVQENEINADLPDEFVKGYFNEISFDNPEENTHVELLDPEGSLLYNWTYSGGWEGDLEFLDIENTTYASQRWIISISIQEDELQGEWELKLNANGNSHEFEINVVEPNTSLTVVGDIDFYLEPYKEDAYSDEQSIRYTNSGNVRTKLYVNYDDENLTHQVSNEIFNPGESGKITFQYHSSDRGLIQFGTKVSINHNPLRKLDLKSEGNIGVGSTESRVINIGVTVGYQGYKQAQGDNYEVQYRDSVEIDGNTEGNLTFYIYPHKDIDFNIFGSDVEIINVSENTNEPLPHKEEENKLTVHFKSHHENNGTVTLIVEGDKYTTNIQLTEKAPQPGNEEISFVEEEAETITFGALLIGGVIIFGLARVLISKGEKD